MGIEFYIEGRVGVLEVKGDLTYFLLQKEPTFFRWGYEDEKLRNIRHVVVECSSLGYADSSGVGWFFVLCKTLQQDGRTVSLCGAPSTFSEALEMLAFYKKISVYPDLKTAMQFIPGASFPPGGKNFNFNA